MRLTLVGHATVLIELDGVRLLTDPLLRDRTAFLRTPGRTLASEWSERLDAVLLSHFHRDHYDRPSLRRLDPSLRVIGPSGAQGRLRRLGRANVEELEPGQSTTVGPLTVRATPALHGRIPTSLPLGSAAVGFVISGSSRVYFAGDTDLFPELAELASEEIDVALVPVAGWGPRLGAGHLDPPRAAEAVRLIAPRLAVPIHWGLLSPVGVGRFNPRYLRDPGEAFARAVAELAPAVEVRILRPGESLELAGSARD
jgi:L-ascorbate metabolism protein UlaG (beta-lactamase superfamily)